MNRLGAKRSLRLEAELDEELETIAELDRRSPSYILRVALEEYLERRRSSDRRRAVRASADSTEA